MHRDDIDSHSTVYNFLVSLHCSNAHTRTPLHYSNAHARTLLHCSTAHACTLFYTTETHMHARITTTLSLAGSSHTVSLVTSTILTRHISRISREAQYANISAERIPVGIHLSLLTFAYDFGVRRCNAYHILSLRTRLHYAYKSA